MSGSVALVVTALTLAVVDWLTARPAPGRPKWPRWVKLCCAFIVACVGLAQILEGYISGEQGIRAYKEGDYTAAIEKLEMTTKGPFANREALDFLALAWKKQAEKATLPLVKEKNFLTAINYMADSINRYPCSPKAHNNLVNVLRRTQRWQEGKDAILQLIDRLEGGFYDTCDPPVPRKDFSTYYVTLGNYFVDDKNPEYSLDKALAYYEKAAGIDSKNRFLILNVPPRLMRLAERQTDPDKKRRYVQQAYTMTLPALQSDDKEDRAFALINIIDALSTPLLGSFISNPLDLRSLTKQLEGMLHSVNLDDEAWLVLAKAYIYLCDHDNASRVLRLAKSERIHYTQPQLDTLATLSVEASTPTCTDGNRLPGRDK